MKRNIIVFAGCVVPMSKRQFPASFWRSDYHQGSSGHHTSATGGGHAGVGGHSTTAAGQSSESVAAAAAGAASLSSLTHAAMHANHAALTAAAAGHPDIYGHATDPYNFLGSYGKKFWHLPFGYYKAADCLLGIENFSGSKASWKDTTFMEMT